MAKLIYGVGFNDRKYLTKVNGKHLREYLIWREAIARCYSPIFQKKRPTYVGCSASENFKSYSYFYEWCQTQIGFGKKGFELDKDLIFKGNKIYSEDTCLFLPSELNSLLTSNKAGRGTLPIGVTAVGNRFRVYCGREPASIFVGSFKTPEEAFNAYKQAKENRVKTQAEKWKALIDPRAYAALMAYEVSPTD